MPLDINDLWDLRDENEWLDALDRYWLNVDGHKSHPIEELINTGDLGYIQKLGMRQWYDFLNKYFHWKFKGNHLQEKLTDLDKNSFEHLFSVKCSLEAVDELDLTDSRQCFNIVKRIRGLDYPGASGLLAVIFKKWFGTVDKCVLESLYAIESLPEKQAIGEIRSWLKRNRDWRECDVLFLIDIMRRKAAQLNGWFGTSKWTPHKIAMILRTFNKPVRAEDHGAQMVRRRRSDEQTPPQS